MTRPLLLIGLLLAGIGSAGGDGDRPEAGAPAATGPLAVGDVARPWRLAEWSGIEPLDLKDLRGRVVVVRFWTDACPFCARSLPALQALAEEFRDRPVTFVAIYHAKPPGREPLAGGRGVGTPPGSGLPPGLRPGLGDAALLVAGGPRPGGDLGQLRHRPARASRARPPRPRVLPDGRPVPGPPGSGLPALAPRSAPLDRGQGHGPRPGHRALPPAGRCRGGGRSSESNLARGRGDDRVRPGPGRCRGCRPCQAVLVPAVGAAAGVVVGRRPRRRRRASSPRGRCPRRTRRRTAPGASSRRGERRVGQPAMLGGVGPGHRSGSAGGQGAKGPSRAIARLIRCLKHPDEAVRSGAAAALQGLDPPLTLALGEALLGSRKPTSGCGSSRSWWRWPRWTRSALCAFCARLSGNGGTWRSSGRPPWPCWPWCRSGWGRVPPLLSSLPQDPDLEVKSRVRDESSSERVTRRPCGPNRTRMNTDDPGHRVRSAEGPDGERRGADVVDQERGHRRRPDPARPRRSDGHARRRVCRPDGPCPNDRIRSVRFPDPSPREGVLWIRRRGRRNDRGRLDISSPNVASGDHTGAPSGVVAAPRSLLNEWHPRPTNAYPSGISPRSPSILGQPLDGPPSTRYDSPNFLS